ncbi:MAG: DUF503 domain-containing protein [Gemmatimonadetes bacterium]|nr:DUF503 domain-containing protein [Gemmatimonadota bacterium]
MISWDLHLAGCASLKDKRRIVKSIKNRLHNEFNVSVAETDHHDLWQRCELSCCVTARDRRHAESVLTAVGNFVEKGPDFRIISSSQSFR